VLRQAQQLATGFGLQATGKASSWSACLQVSWPIVLPPKIEDLQTKKGWRPLMLITMGKPAGATHGMQPPHDTQP